MEFEILTVKVRLLSYIVLKDIWDFKRRFQKYQLDFENIHESSFINEFVEKLDFCGLEVIKDAK